MGGRGYIDFHTHIFPDRIAEEALRKLSEHSGPYRPRTDATLSGLVSSMDRAGICTSVIANIATRASQMIPIYEFALNIKSSRVYPLVSFHPDNPINEVQEMLKAARKAGIRGVKLHPMYQGFFIDDRKMYPFYELIASLDMFLMFHSGYDIAFPGNRQADIERVATVAKEIPSLSIISTHMGGWKQWERLHLLRDLENVFIETSMTITEIGPERFKKLLMSFDPERILFGTDSPWTDQKEMIQAVLSLDLSEALKEKILYRNAVEFLKNFGFNDTES